MQKLPLMQKPVPSKMPVARQMEVARWALRKWPAQPAKQLAEHAQPVKQKLTQQKPRLALKKQLKMPVAPVAFAR
jgi:hypothetical protein